MINIIKKYLDKKTALYLLIITTVFSFLYFPQTLIMNENIETIAAFEIDASLMVDSVFQHLKTYNMQTGYMSRFYGWSYFFINYIILKPITLLEKILNIENISFNLFLIKIIFYLISFSSCIVFFILLKKIFKKNSISLLGSLLYIFFPLKNNFFTDIKPETTGLLFLFLSQIFLINFIENKKNKKLIWYLASIVTLTLSILAKQSFVFLVFPIIIIFYSYFIKQEKLNFIRNVFTKKIFLIVIFSILTVISVTFIIYPHLFKHPDNFINAQKILLKDHNSSGSLTLKGQNLFDSWWSTIWNNPFLRIIIFSYPISFLVIFLTKNKLKIFFIINLLFLPTITFVLCKNAALFINPNYLTPLILIFILVLLLPFSNSLFIKNKIIKKTILGLYFSIFVILISYQFFNTYNNLKNRKEYKQSEVFQVSDYISKEINKNSRLAISDSIFIPNKESYQICHWWQNCSIKTYLDEFNPDYLIFIKNTSYNGIEPEFYLNYINYSKEHNFQLQKTIGKFVIYKKNDSI